MYLILRYILIVTVLLVAYLAVTRHDIQPEMNPQVGPRAAVNDDALGR